MSCVDRTRPAGGFYPCSMAREPERLTRAQLTELAEASSDVTFRGSLEGSTTWISPTVTELMGWTPEEVVGQPFLALVHPDDAALIPQARARADEGELARFRVRLRRSDGSYRWIDVLLRTSFDQHGLPCWRYGSWRDAEREVVQEQRLEAAADRGRRILDGMLDPWVVLSPVHDAQGHVVDLVFTEANARACEYNQVTYDELVGARLLELLPAHRGSDLYAGYLHTLETGEPLVLDDYVYPREIYGGADRRYDIRVTRIDEGLSFTWRDVTSRSEERVRLARSEARFAAALRSEIDPHVIFEAVRGSREEILDLRYSEVNPAAASYLGSTVDQLRGSCLSAVGTPAFSEALTSLSAVINSGVPLVLNSWVVDSIHGPQRVLDVRAVRVGDGVSVIWRDITDEHIAHQRIAEAEELLDASFAAELDGHVLLQAVRNPDGEILDFRVLRSNSVGAAYLGHSVPDTIGLTIREFAPADAAERAIRQYATVVETGEPWVARKTADMPDAEGHRLDVHVVKSLDGVGVTFRDVTDQVLAGDALAAAEELLRVNMDAVIDPLVLLQAVRNPDTGDVVDFVYLEVNEAACAYLSTPRENLIGRGILEMAPGQVDVGLFALYVSAIDRGAPTVVDDVLYDNEIINQARYYDIRARGVSGDRLSVTWRDVTERHEFVARIAESEKQFRLLSTNATEMVGLWRDGKCLWLSPSTLALLGIDQGQALGLDARLLVHEEDRERFDEANSAAAAGRPQVVRLRLLLPDGSMHWVEIHAGPYVDEDGQGGYVLTSSRMIDDLMAAEHELEQRARFDVLTGLMNRSEVLRTVARMSTQRLRTGELTALLFCDIDGFKEINDEHGHAAGDEVLRTLGERLACTIRADDYAARMGGDELLVVLTGLHDLDEAVGIAEKIRVAASEPIGLEHGVRITPTLSIGVTLARPGESTDRLIERADNAMYDAKRGGRNRVASIA